MTTTVRHKNVPITLANGGPSSAPTGQATMLITTKLHIPPMKSRMIMRRHLTDRLREGSSSRLVVICGLPGSGKTSLACQWIAEDHLPVAWYSLDKTDNDADLFFRYLLTSLGTIDDTIASQVAPLLQELRQFSGPEIIPLIIRLFVDLPRDIYLVLDDYHLIHTKEIHDALSYFLEYMPPRMHMVILSRHAIPLSLSRFRVRSQLTEIVASDLKFTEEETERFFTDIMPVTLTTDEVHELARYTEGWVGGLQLFGLSLKGKGLNDLGDILSRACQETTDYLIDEVIKVQPRKVKTFIQTTALLDRFNVDLCREVTGFTDTPDILEHLYRNNLFLIPLNTENTWHRYHHLLSEAVRKGVKNINPALYRDIQRKAALWFARHGYLEDAFRHAFASEDQQFAADLLEDYIPLLQERYDVASGLRWLAKVPHEVFMQRALLRLHECSLKIESLQLLDIEATLSDIKGRETDAFERYEGSKRELCRDLLAYLEYVLPYFQEPADTDTNHLSDDLKRIIPDSKPFSGFIEDIIVGRHLIQADLPQAYEALKKASTKIFLSDNVWARIIWSKSMAYVERWQGSLDRSETILKETLGFLAWKGLGDTPLKYILYPAMAWLAFFRNDMLKALEYGTVGLRYAEQARSVYNIIELNHLLAHIHLAEGAHEETDRCMKGMLWVAKATGSPNLVALTNAFFARLSLAQGDLAWAEHWANQRQLSVDEPFSYRFVHECMAQADLLYRQGRYDRLANMLETLRSHCVSRNMLEQVLDIDIFYGAALHALYGDDRFKKVMERALVFAETEGYIRSFIYYAPMVASTLVDTAGFIRAGKGSSLLSMIVKTCVTPKNKKGTEKGRIRELTQREVEILRLLAGGYKYKEVAEKAFISLDTVRTHTKHIFEKLDVKTKDQAVREAERLNILSDGV